jgi:hypothetical protein
MIFFLQDEIRPADMKNVRRKKSWWMKPLRVLGSSIPKIGHSNAKIGKRIGMIMSEDDLSYARKFLECCSDDWGRLINETTIFRTLSPFKDRVDKLHEVLKVWKPKTVWEMGYPGYGGVDPVGLYAFYFATALGVITVLSLAVAIAQTFATFKALDLPSNP